MNKVDFKVGDVVVDLLDGGVGIIKDEESLKEITKLHLMGEMVIKKCSKKEIKRNITNLEVEILNKLEFKKILTDKLK